MAKGLSDHIISEEQPKVLTELEKWRQDDAKAMYILSSGMELSQITLVETCKTAKEIIDTLDSIYELRSENSKMLLFEKFHCVTFLGKNIAEQISQIVNIAQQLKDAGETISDLAAVTRILGSLPEKYQMVRQAWMSLDVKKQTVPNLTARLLDEEKNLQSSEETALTTENEKPKKKMFRCFKCYKKGHFARDCRQKVNNSGGTTSKNHKDCAFTAQLLFDDASWIVDNGASAHMTYRREFLHNFQPRLNCVRLGDRSELSVQGVGTVKIQKLIEGKGYDSTINDVLYVPELKRNLFSEGVVTSKGFSVTKSQDKAIIVDNEGSVMATAIKQTNNLFHLVFKTVCLSNESDCQQANVVSLKQWHERLGLVSVHTLHLTRNDSKWTPTAG